MVKLVSAKCPSCGASLKLSKDNESVECEFCHNTIIVDDAIACYKLKISGTVSVDGITTNAELIEAANELLDMGEYLKAKRKFLEFSEKCPDSYQGWLGLLICRTRNFTIKDNNVMFENDVNKYYEHFKRVAPKNIQEEYSDVIENYFHPEKLGQQLIEKINNTKTTVNSNNNLTSSNKNNTWLWVLGWIFCFPIPLTVLIWRSKWNKTIKIIVTILLWGFVLLAGSPSESTENPDLDSSTNNQSQEVTTTS